ncbi:MAG: glycosyltransferase family 39 protein, partial [Deltaproteobacteria bacterium]|nr:glycosyltransferase family 39 protein [Deltaproteobacteria bacterium]
PVAAFAGTAAILDAPFWLLFTLALVAFDRFLRTGSRRDALVVGIWTAVACMARYNAVLLPPVYLAIVAIVPVYRPFARRAATWIVVFTPALLVLPWIAYSAATGTLAVQATRIASFALTAFIPDGGAFYLRQYMLPLVPFMVGFFNLPLWVNGAIRAWRDGDGAPGRVFVVAAAAYAALLAFTLPNPRYLLAVGALLAFLAAREVLDIEEREGRGAHVLVYLLGWAALHVAVVLQQTAVGSVYLFY